MTTEAGLRLRAVVLGRQGGGWETGAVPMACGGGSFTVVRHSKGGGDGNSLSDSLAGLNRHSGSPEFCLLMH